MTVYKASVPSAEWRDVGLDAALRCECGHELYKHQSGSGAWTGFCEDDDCKCEWPTLDSVKRVAAEHGVAAEHLRELVEAPRDEDGWPVGITMTEAESFALQEHDQEAMDKAVDHGASYAESL